MEERDAKTNISCIHKTSLLLQVINKRMSIISEYYLDFFFLNLPVTMSIAHFHYVLKQIQNKAVLTVSHTLMCSCVSLIVAIVAENVCLRETRESWGAGGDKRKSKTLV